MPGSVSIHDGRLSLYSEPMVGWARICIGLLVFVGCKNPATFSCQDDAGCGADGSCESTGFCSFPDAECASGRRYGELAGTGLTGQCVATDAGSTGVGDSTGTSGAPPEDCAPGSLGCPCDGEGQCTLTLECLLDVCVPAGVDSVTSETGSSSGAFGSTTWASSSTDTSGTSESSASTGPGTTTEPVSCDMESETCADCFDCTGTNECSSEFEACAGIEGCIAAAECVQTCLVGGACFEDCCEGESQGLRDAVEALNSCRADTCIAGPCKTYASPPNGFCGSS